MILYRVVHVCPDKILKFATKTFSKRRLLPLYDFYVHNKKLFSSKRLLLHYRIATNAQNSDLGKLTINVQLQQTVSQDYIQGNMDKDFQSVSKQKQKKPKEKVQIFLFN